MWVREAGSWDARHLNGEMLPFDVLLLATHDLVGSLVPRACFTLHSSVDHPVLCPHSSLHDLEHPVSTQHYGSTGGAKMTSGRAEASESSHS
jgi:hypothetical protein